MLELISILKKLDGNISANHDFQEAMVFAVWRQAAGFELSKHTVPVNFEKKRLTIAASNKAWQFQLKGLSAELLYKINARLGDSTVTFIEFVIDEETVRHFNNIDADVKISTESEILSGLSPSLQAKAEAIENEELRKNFLLAAGRSLELKAKRQS